MFLRKRLSDVCGWAATTYASLYYHGNCAGRGAYVRRRCQRCVCDGSSRREVPYLFCTDTATPPTQYPLRFITLLFLDKDGCLILLFGVIVRPKTLILGLTMSSPSVLGCLSQTLNLGWG